MRHFIDQIRWKASKSTDKLASTVGLHGAHLEMILAGLPECLVQLQAEGRQCVSTGELRHRLGVSKPALAASLTRQLQNGALARLHPGFYVLLRPEDRVYGLPDPLQWLDPLMVFLGNDYRVSLWRSAALHGSSHQAAMAVQVVTPRELRPIQLGRVRVTFLYQQPAAFAQVNCSPWIKKFTTPQGYTTVAGVELTLADCLHYVNQLGGIDHAAQIIKDLADQIDPNRLYALALLLQNTLVRRLGYLLSVMGHPTLATVLEPFAKRSRSWIPLAPREAEPLVAGAASAPSRDPTWKLILNHTLELDD